MSNHNNTSWEIKSKIRKGEPLEYKNLIFYPITMAHYEEFISVKDALTTRQSTFPVKYAVMNFITAIWALDLDARRETGRAIGLFERILRCLYLSLRLNYKYEEVAKTVYFDRRDPYKLLYIIVRQNENEVQLTPQELSFNVRNIIAQQNGLELPDESYNPDLVQAERDLKEIRGEKLKYDPDTLISSVAYLSHVDERSIDGWTILQFTNRVRAIERDKSYMLYRQAELGGMVKFPKGNPCPSWCYDKEEGLSPALRTVADVNKNVSAVGDINQAVQATRTTKH